MLSCILSIIVHPLFLFSEGNIIASFFDIDSCAFWLRVIDLTLDKSV